MQDYQSFWTTNQKSIPSRAWWHVHVMPTLGRQKQEDCQEFKAILCYIASSKPTWTAQQDRLKKPKTKNKTKNPYQECKKTTM